jgi:hypothetical protein
LLGLTLADIDLDRNTIHPHKQADDRTRVLRELKFTHSHHGRNCRGDSTLPERPLEGESAKTSLP